jgi:16S rRNA C1402 N4-methylase RsmH
MADCTFGGGGHTIKLLNQHSSHLKVLGLDLDPDVIEQCSLEYSDLIKKRKLALVHSNFVHLPSISAPKAFGRKTSAKNRYDMVLMDLGFSSY